MVRLRLAVLCLVVLAVTTGVALAQLPSGGERATRSTTEQGPAPRGAACTPGFDTGIDDEPWRSARRDRSERVFRARIEKEHRAYVRGRGDWVFFSDVQDKNFSQALGRKTLTAKQRRAWASWIATSQRTVEQAGGRYFVVVAPANWDVYWHKLPRWAKRLRGTTSLDTMLREHPELPWIDTRAALREAARDHHTYEPLNSHWTPYGGYVAWQAITRCLRATAAPGDPTYDDVRVPAITGVGQAPDASEFGADGLPGGEPRSTYPIFAEPHPPTTVTHLPDGAPIENRPDHSTDTNATPLKTRTPEAQAPELRLLTLRDSMGHALSPLWSTSFGTTFQYGHGINQMGFTPPDLAAVVAEHRPDVVLFVITERWLFRRPPG